MEPSKQRPRSLRRAEDSARPAASSAAEEASVPWRRRPMRRPRRGRRGATARLSRRRRRCRWPETCWLDLLGSASRQQGLSLSLSLSVYRTERERKEIYNALVTRSLHFARSLFEPNKKKLNQSHALFSQFSPLHPFRISDGAGSGGRRHREQQNHG